MAGRESAARLHQAKALSPLEFLFFRAIILKYGNVKTYLRYCITDLNLRLFSMLFWSSPHGHEEEDLRGRDAE